MALHGKNATLRFATTVLEAREWNITRTQETADVTNFGSDGHRDRITGLQDWSGTFVTERNANIFGLQSTATFRPSTSTVSTTNPYFNGKVIITGRTLASIKTWTAPAPNAQVERLGF